MTKEDKKLISMFVAIIIVALIGVGIDARTGRPAQTTNIYITVTPEALPALGRSLTQNDASGAMPAFADFLKENLAPAVQAADQPLTKGEAYSQTDGTDPSSCPALAETFDPRSTAERTAAIACTLAHFPERSNIVVDHSNGGEYAFTVIGFVNCAEVVEKGVDGFTGSSKDVISWYAMPVDYRQEIIQKCQGA
jgi:hypothetical protein